MKVRATVLQTPRYDELEVLEDHVVEVAGGEVVSVRPAAEVEPGDVDVTVGSSKVLLPGLIDTHVHAPQWTQRGKGLDLPLERWLFEYTFPLEARFADTAFAVEVFDSLIPGLLRRGTTTAVYHCTIHEEATLALARACVAHGQRALVGRVAMDHPDGAPEGYRDASASEAVAATERSVAAIASLEGAAPLVRPIITPRFIPACTDALLEGLGELAAATGVQVQTHCSENDWEHDYVVDRHGCTDTESLARFGLVGDHTILAHCTHLTDSDRRTIVETGAGAAHCPLSNAYFASGVFAARRNLEAGMRIGLGSDVAGGAEASLLAQCEHAVTMSRVLESGVDVGIDPERRGLGDSRIDITTAFWFATAGGAELVGIDAGLLAPGRVFDAFTVDIGENSSVGVYADTDGWDDVFEKVVRSASVSDIGTVWVDGREVLAP